MIFDGLVKIKLLLKANGGYLRGIGKMVSMFLRKGKKGVRAEWEKILLAEAAAALPPIEYTDDDHLNSLLKSPLRRIGKNEPPWIFVVEILSLCDLRCVLCAHGNKHMFQRADGMMSLEYFEKVLDKIESILGKFEKNDSPVTVFPFHHCEPTLHPFLPEIVHAIHLRGFLSHISLNFNRHSRLEDLLKEKPGSITISVSGFSQQQYAKSHCGGDIERVKVNMRTLRSMMDNLDVKLPVVVNYHMYKDNLGDDYDKMRAFTKELGFNFAPTWARCISTELCLQYLRETKLGRRIPGTSSWFDEMPPLPQKFMDDMKRIVHLPEDYVSGAWQDARARFCPSDRHGLAINWNGRVNLCGCGFDERFSAGDFLECELEEIYKIRENHPICKECMANNVGFYINSFDAGDMNEIAKSRLSPSISPDRISG